MGGGLAFEELMENARKRALLDDWNLDGNEVRLTVGTYEIELHRQAAKQFVEGLLKNYESAMSLAGE